MHLSTLMIADAARVRDGLLHVIGGGITTVTSGGFPVAPQAEVAVILEIAPGEFNGHLAIKVSLEHKSSDAVLDRVSGYEGQFVGVVQSPDLPSVVPLSLTLSPLEVPGPGEYVIVVEIGDIPARRLPLSVRGMESPEFD